MSSRNLPHHLYVYVDSAFFRGGEQRFEPAVWFAIRSEEDRAWGCHVMPEQGAAAIAERIARQSARRW